MIGIGHRVFDAAIRQAHLLETQIAIISALERPLFIFEIWDRITGTGSQLSRVLVGVSTRDDQSMQILRDWEVVKLINELKFSARSQEGATDSTPATAVYLQAVRRSEAHLRASFAELSLPFKLPELRLAVALLS